MGCQSSKSDGVAPAPLSEEAKQKVRESWAWFTEDEDLRNKSCLIFVKLFELAPTSRILFHFVDDVTEEALTSNAELQRHARRVIEAISIVVDRIDHQDVVAKTVRELGGRHAGYGVKEAYVSPVAQGVMYALKRTLTTRFTPEHEKAWNAVLGLVGQLFVKGLKENKGK